MSTTILDGGLSNALEDRGHDLSSDLWTARVLVDAPGEIAAVHRAYYDAGATVATTASYQAPDDLLGRSVRLARAVRDERDEEGLLVAASVGPYGASLADGSEYRGRYGVPTATLRDFHARRVAALVEAEPDLLAVETVPDAEEAEVLVPLLEDAGLPAWFSYSVDGDRTRAGQPLAEAYGVLAGSRVLVAAGVNCARPADVLGAVRAAVAATGLPAVAYPNRGEDWDPVARAWVGAGGVPLELARAWVAAGASYVGGCCRVGPADIRALADGLAAGA
ncbi:MULTISPECIES: homocysteine S-methyltransferase [unclassified Nocardioides]|uniref:homocysteine S-methyltransferase n=1 Tax=unclassified Nocardioides TaxID=2615069 RepID=UPI0030146E4F